MKRSAVISECGRYRYSLERCWDDGLPMVTWVMLNPSTADAETDDQTIRKCVGFARKWGAGRIRVVNLFALRSTDPRALRTSASPVGPGNNNAIVEAARRSAVIVAAWGAHGKLIGRDGYVRWLVDAQDRRLSCLGVTKDGHPRHPLRLPYSTELVWLERAEAA